MNERERQAVGFALIVLSLGIFLLFLGRAAYHSKPLPRLAPRAQAVRWPVDLNEASREELMARPSPIASWRTGPLVRLKSFSR